MAQPFMPDPYRLTGAQEDRAVVILREFVAWRPEIGPCPIGPNNAPWFKRLAAMAERVAILESLVAEARAGEAALHQRAAALEAENARLAAAGERP